MTQCCSPRRELFVSQPLHETHAGSELYTDDRTDLELMTHSGFQMEVVIDQLNLAHGAVCYESVVACHAVVQVCDALLKVLDLPLNNSMPAGNSRH